MRWWLFGFLFGWLGFVQAVGVLPQANLSINPYQGIVGKSITLDASLSRSSTGIASGLQYRFQTSADQSAWTDWQRLGWYEFKPQQSGDFRARVQVKDAQGLIQTTYRSYRVKKYSRNRLKIIAKNTWPEVGTQVEWEIKTVLDGHEDPLDFQTRWDFDNDGKWDQDWTNRRNITHVYNLSWAGRKLTPSVEVKWPDNSTEVVSGHITATWKESFYQESRPEIVHKKELFIPHQSAQISLKPASLVAPILQVKPGTTIFNSKTVFEFDASASRIPAHAWLEWSFDGGTKWQTFHEKVVRWRAPAQGEYLVSVRTCYQRQAPQCRESQVKVQVLDSDQDFQPRIQMQLPGSFWGGNNTNQVVDSIVQDEITFNATIQQQSQSSQVFREHTQFLYRWDFEGDNVWDTPFATTATAKHRYLRSGVYAPQVQVTRNNVRGTPHIEIASEQIIIKHNSPPRADFSVTKQPGSNRVTAGDRTWFRGVLSDKNSRNIYLKGRFDVDGDGRWDQDWTSFPQLSWVYEKPGSYRVRLQVKDPQGSLSAQTKTVQVFAKQNAPSVKAGNSTASLANKPPVASWKNIGTNTSAANNSTTLGTKTAAISTKPTPIIDTQPRAATKDLIKVRVSHRVRETGQVFRFDVEQSQAGLSDWQWYFPNENDTIVWRAGYNHPLQLKWVTKSPQPGTIQFLPEQDFRETETKRYRAFRTAGEKVVTVSALDQKGKRHFFSFSVWVIGKSVQGGNL